MNKKVDEFKRRDYSIIKVDPDENHLQVVKPGSILCRIDWFTVVFNDCSIQQALNSISFSVPVSDDYDRVYNERYLASQGYLPDLILNFDGVIVKVSYSDVLSTIDRVQEFSSYDEVDRFRFFDLVFRKIRVDISGSALNNLRSRGIDVDTLFFRPLPTFTDVQTYHVTRCDFAFDLLDYQTNFLKDCILWCQNNGNPDSQRIAVGDCRGIKYSIRTGDQETLYLGAGSSDRLLRIYNKGMQFKKSNHPFPYVYESGELPSSWIRIELQTRREETTHLCLYGHPAEDSVDCFLAVYRYIYDRFGFYKDGQTVDLWKSLFDWSQISGVLCKSLILYKKTSAFDRARQWVASSAFKAICVIVSEIGWDAFKDLINSQFRRLQTSQFSCDKMRFNSILLSILDNRSSLPDYIHTDGSIYHIGTI